MLLRERILMERKKAIDDSFIILVHNFKGLGGLRERLEANE